MQIRRRDAAALIVALVAFALGVLGVGLGGRFDPGTTLSAGDGHLYISDVAPFSPAFEAGIRTGMVVTSIDGTDVLDASPELLASMSGRRLYQNLEAVWPEAIPGVRAERDWEARQALVTPDPSTGETPQLPYPQWSFSVYPVYLGSLQYDQANSFPQLEFGLGLFLLGLGWLAAGRAGEGMRRLAVTLPAATAAPLLLAPWMLAPNVTAVLSGAIVLALAMLPLALDLSERMRTVPDRTRLLIPLAFAALSIVLALAPIAGLGITWSRITSGGVAACAVFASGALAAWPVLFPQPDEASGPKPSGLVEAAELLMVAAAPGVAVVSTYHGSLMWPIVVWILAILAVRRFTLRPLARLATRATQQRDAIVAATEAERARIAADIHDDALQDLTMLIRRLDASGDTENAEAAREVASRLRAICGELRLPILDDLGLGPALEWLTDRFEQIAKGPVYLERLRDEPRVPRNVELAIFRVCQEALANAVKHGRPPIVVRYRSGGRWAELEVDDSGPGLAPGASALAADAGHFGLLNMAQRAEQVGAELIVGRRPGGGTRVRVVWEAAGGAAPERVEAAGQAEQSTEPGMTQVDAPRPGMI